MTSPKLIALLTFSAVGLSCLLAVAEEEGVGAFKRKAKLPEKLQDVVDADGDGQVSDQEAGEAVKQFQIEAKAKTEVAKQVREALDLNGDGRVDAQEAAQAIAQHRAEVDPTGKFIAEVFEKLDVDQNGVVVPQEFMLLAEKFGKLAEFVKPKLKETFLKLDVDRNRVITPVEAQMAADQISRSIKQKQAAEEQKRNQRIYNIAVRTVLQLDRSGNKRIDIGEANELLSAHFANIDADGNKKLSAAELYEYLVNNPQLLQR